MWKENSREEDGGGRNDKLQPFSSMGGWMAWAREKMFYNVAYIEKQYNKLNPLPPFSQVLSAFLARIMCSITRLTGMWVYGKKIDFQKWPYHWITAVLTCIPSLHCDDPTCRHARSVTWSPHLCFHKLCLFSSLRLISTSADGEMEGGGWLKPLGGWSPPSWRTAFVKDFPLCCLTLMIHQNIAMIDG